MRKFKAVLMRGGVCRGLIFKQEDLPADHAEWDRIFLQALGGPDAKQIDGVGGGVSSNSKAVVVSKSNRADVDIEYTSVQIVVGSTTVDYSANCGNMSAAVGPFAIEEGLVSATHPITEIRMLNLNTNKIVVNCVPTENGILSQDGDFCLDGIDGTAPRIELRFLNPAGAKTGRLLPTGHWVDRLHVEGFADIDATILDVSNPMVLVRAEDVGLMGTELPTEFESNEAAMTYLEAIRCTAAMKIGFGKTMQDARDNFSGVPKIAVFTAPQAYIDLTGRKLDASDMDICVRVLSVRQPHKASPFTSANAIAVAAVLSNTLPGAALNLAGRTSVRIGHPSGVMHIPLSITNGNVDYVSIESTARRIMDGFIRIRV